MQVRQCGRAGRVVGAAVAGALLFSVVEVSPAPAEEARERPPSGTVTLAEAVGAALRFDPALAAYGFEEEARAARVRQEGRLPNPTLAAEAENVARFGGRTSEAEAAQTTISLTQVLELGGKRAHRVEVATLDGRLARRDTEGARLDTAARTAQAFVAALLAQERVALAERSRDLGADSVAAARRQMDAGGGSAIEVARAEATLAQADALVARRERESRRARGLLASHWGGGDASIERLAGALAPLPTPPALRDLEARLEAAPDLARWREAIGRAEAGVELERSRRVPDLAVRVGARRFVDAESNALVAELSLPLPVFDRNADAIVEAEARVGKTRAERDAAFVAAANGLRSHHAEMLAAHAEARALEAAVLPPARAALRETRRGYGEGRLRYLDVLDAERAVADVEESRLEALARYHTAAAEVERMVGGSAAPTEGAAR